MTHEQQVHRDQIVAIAQKAIYDKYTAGAEEHQSNLKEDHTIEQLLDFAIEEAIDQVVYLFTMKQKMEESNEATRA